MDKCVKCGQPLKAKDVASTTPSGPRCRPCTGEMLRGASRVSVLDTQKGRIVR